MLKIITFDFYGRKTLDKRNSIKKGIDLYFVLPPRLPEGMYAELNAVLDQLPSKNVIKLYKYPQHSEFYTSANSFDLGHLNDKGAYLFTTELATQIRNKIAAQK